MIVLDTSVWVGILRRSDFHHLASRAWYRRWRTASGTLHLPALCLAELAGVLGRAGESPETALRLIDALQTQPEIQLHPLDRGLARFSAEVAVTARLKGADASYVALAAALDLPLITWDKEQGERGARFCRTMTPIEAMEMAE